MTGGKKRVTVGNITTQHEREKVTVEVKDGEVSGLDDFRAALAEAQKIEEAENSDPWAHNAAVAIRFANQLIDAETRKAPFRERQDKGWYGREILFLEKEVRTAILNGHAAWAAVYAAQMGDLSKEAVIKFNWDPLVEYAQTTHEQREEGGKNSRKYSAEEYVAAWREQYEICGKKTEADRLAAEALSAGNTEKKKQVGESTIRQARLKAGL